MTPINLKDAARLVNADYNYLVEASKKGMLTRLPSTTSPMLIKEQVELFKDKKGFSQRLLNDEEKKLWKQYDEEAKNSSLSSSVVIEPKIDLEKVSDELTRMVLQKLSSVLSMSSEKTKVYL